MIVEGDGYSVEFPDGDERAVLRGVMRLASAHAYEQAFAGLRAQVDMGRALTIDLCGVQFMNSSGIRVLAGLVLRARDCGAALRLVASARVPWQKKTIASLRTLDRGLAVDLC
jgi:anti-anti-sigma factor